MALRVLYLIFVRVLGGSACSSHLAPCFAGAGEATLDKRAWSPPDASGDQRAGVADGDGECWWDCDRK